MGTKSCYVSAEEKREEWERGSGDGVKIFFFLYIGNVTAREDVARRAHGKGEGA